MAGNKETPRQKMINMMYLVLTAMLALNVSKEVLDGYTAVNDSVLLTNQNFGQKRESTYDNFEKEYQLNQIEVAPFWDKAKEVMKLSDGMTAYIDSLRNELVAFTERIPLDSAKVIPLGLLRKKDNYTTPTLFLIGANDSGTKGRAQQLKERLDTYRETILGMTNPKYRGQVKIGLETDGTFYNADRKKQTWIQHNFYDIPLAASVTILNKLISEVNDAELEIVNALLRESIAEDFKYDRIEAKILPKSNYIFTGENYEAEVVVAAYDTSHSPSPSVFIKMGVDTLMPAQRAEAIHVERENGHLMIKIPGTTPGVQKYAGFVSVPTASGRERTYHFRSNYFVAEPSVTISPTNMNVLYTGVDNPVSLAVAGIPDESIIPTISTGTLRRTPRPDKWIVNVPLGFKEATITVKATIDGELKQIGTETFRVKQLPDPIPYIAQMKEGFVGSDELVNAGKIVAKMPYDFEFNYTFPVVSFTMTMQRGFVVYHYESDSNLLTDEMINELSRTNRGQLIIFENIMAKGPNGELRTLSPLYLTIR